MSAPFMMAATLHGGQLGVLHFKNEFAQGPLHALLLRIDIFRSGAIRRGNCIVSVRTMNGEEKLLAFTEEAPFVFNCEDTKGLIREISREWPGSHQVKRLHALIQGVDEMESPTGYAKLLPTIYGVGGFGIGRCA